MTRVFDEDLTAGFGTRAIHAGQRPDPLAGAIMTPVYLTSTYVQEGLGQNKGYEYARGKNPTREAFERNVAALENGRHGFAFSSGMGCLDSIMKLFRAGDHIVCGENVYGGTFRLFDKILQNYGLTFTYVDTRDPQRIADAMTPTTRAVLVETPTNPLMRVTDIAAAAEIAHRGDAAADRRQHLRVAVLPATARVRRGHRLPLDDQVPERAQRHDRRLRRRDRRRARRATAVHSQCRGRRRGPVRRLARAARHEDAAPPHAPARRERPRDREVARRAGRPRERVLHRPPDASAARPGPASDDRIRRHDQRRARHARARRPRARARARLCARRVARRRGVADQPAGRNDARVGPARAPRRDRPQRRADSAVLRRGGRGRPAGRPGAGL